VQAGVQEDHVHAGRNPGEHVRHDGVGHRAGDAEARAERVGRPLRDLLGGRALEPAAGVERQRLQLTGRATVRGPRCGRRAEGDEIE
jgi:hypothetical protein